MTVLKDVRTLVDDAIAAAVAFLEGGTPEQTNTYNNGVIDVPAKPSVVISVDQATSREIIDSGYWPADAISPASTPSALAPAAAEAAMPLLNGICDSGEDLHPDPLEPVGRQVPGADHGCLR